MEEKQPITLGVSSCHSSTISVTSDWIFPSASLTLVPASRLARLQYKVECPLSRLEGLVRGESYLDSLKRKQVVSPWSPWLSLTGLQV